MKTIVRKTNTDEIKAKVEQEHFWQGIVTSDTTSMETLNNWENRIHDWRRGMSIAFSHVEDVDKVHEQYKQYLPITRGKEVVFYEVQEIWE